MVGRDGSRTIVQVVDGDVAVATWRVDGRIRPDLAFVDALARLQLAARRRGWSIQLCNPSDDLRALISLVGLADVLIDVGELRLDPSREAEGGELFGIQEMMQPGDPAV